MVGGAVVVGGVVVGGVVVGGTRGRGRGIVVGGIVVGGMVVGGSGRRWSSRGGAGKCGRRRSRHDLRLVSREEDIDVIVRTFPRLPRDTRSVRVDTGKRGEGTVGHRRSLEAANIGRVRPSWCAIRHDVRLPGLHGDRLCEEGTLPAGHTIFDERRRCQQSTGGRPQPRRLRSDVLDGVVELDGADEAVGRRLEVRCRASPLCARRRRAPPVRPIRTRSRMQLRRR